MTKERGPGTCSWAAAWLRHALNTDLKRELDHLARISTWRPRQERRVQGQFYIEPNPRSPPAPYDFDAEGLLRLPAKYDPADHFKMNIEAKPATWAGHTFQHELEFCFANNILAPTTPTAATPCGLGNRPVPDRPVRLRAGMYCVGGGGSHRGLNFDAKVPASRRRGHLYPHPHRRHGHFAPA